MFVSVPNVLAEGGVTAVMSRVNSGAWEIWPVSAPPPPPPDADSWPRPLIVTVTPSIRGMIAPLPL